MKLSDIFWSIVLILVASSCNQKDIEKEKITFGVNVKGVGEGKSIITMQFKANDSIRFIFDWKVVFQFCPINEDSLLLTKLDDPVYLRQHLKRSQIILENDLHEFVIYSLNDVADVDVEYPLEVANCFGEWYEYFKLGPGESKTITSDTLSNFPLTISKAENKRRFHYYFIPTEIQRRRGYYPVVVTSNWF